MIIRIFDHISYPENTEVTSFSRSKNGDTPSENLLSFLNVVFVTKICFFIYNFISYFCNNSSYSSFNVPTLFFSGIIFIKF